jgi:L-asparaginase
VATAGAGATSGTQGQGIQYALEKGVFVVMTTRTGSGRIAARNRVAATSGTPNPRDRAIAGEDLAPVKARLLLMVALTKTQDPAEIQRYFLEY